MMSGAMIEYINGIEVIKAFNQGEKVLCASDRQGEGKRAVLGRGVFPVVGDDLEIDLRILFMHQIVELGHIAVRRVHGDDLMLAGGGIVITRVVAGTAAKQRRHAAQR